MLLVKNEDKVKTKSINRFIKSIISLEDKSNICKYINKVLKSNYDKDYIINNIKTIISNLSFEQLIRINKDENFNILKMIKKPCINVKDINNFIKHKNLKLSYTIINKNTYNYDNNIYSMHSIGKVFTGFLIMILLNEEVFTKEDILSKPKFNNKILQQLPAKVVERLNEITMLDLMTHKSGLGCYGLNYVAGLEKNHKNIPYNPEDFIKYIDDVMYEKNKLHYSNSGFLLLGLCIEELYNIKNNISVKYNYILYKYIIIPAKLSTFSITRPKNGLFNNNKDLTIAEYISGNPAGSYYISTKELAKFGVFILKYIKNTKIMKYIKLYGEEFYKDNIICHGGGLPGSSCYLFVYLKHNISISIMDNNGNDSYILRHAITYLS